MSAWKNSKKNESYYGLCIFHKSFILDWSVGQKTTEETCVFTTLSESHYIQRLSGITEFPYGVLVLERRN